ncbi:hypothetical protein LTS07_005537 [Exophiala sideris]|uniref:Amidohydrolase-related domain-containing protein n=1 Tax=Exophiala sideris TaxID=1016849 RepID=A0ABR0J8J6_9EURO|nr:hypothetical protein LTR13_010380 [Exophiala sideris]KAK5029813.1 hypothetical protein LTS07_005537 [Exophiala sideris]KAK5058425.1 hypothetical protein LTR69_006830 [Exophiala sideris]KAK5178602.1 hypothetical protein LTR44_008973 [Eurotiomycetes sp. CCFEE 6388]
MKLQNVILPGRDPKSRWDVDYENDTINTITPAIASTAPGCTASSSNNPSPFTLEESPDPASLLLPPLCHPHIHLDKAYLLTCNAQHNPRCAGTGPLPEYTDLAPQDGSFKEALEFTARAKQRYTPEDLYLRGSQLLGTSLGQGVTSCRAFVELDHVTGRKCLDAAVNLKKVFNGMVRVQICAFAQDPIFSTGHGEENRQILSRALEECSEGDIEVLGTTPYVENSREASLENIKWAVETALTRGLHLDFHLDYNLDREQSVMTWDVLQVLKEKRWKDRAQPGKAIVLGHCTRLTLCEDEEMERLAKTIKEWQLPVHFVGLPTSDLFMMGRSTSGDRRRGTIQVLDMISRGMDACLSVNNVGNAFTPWGTGDPIALASLGVGVYQAGTEEDAVRLYECVSTRARRAIGLESENDTVALSEGRKGEVLLVRNEQWVGCPGHLGMKIPARQWVSVRDVVWDPPDVGLRQIVRGG